MVFIRLTSVLINKIVTESIVSKVWCRNGSHLSYIHNVGKEPLFYKTIGELIDQAGEIYPEREAVVFCEDGVKFTFKEIKEQTDIFAAGLLQIGLKKGDRLAIWGPNTSEWYISFLSAAKIGVLSVLLNPEFQLNEVEYSLSKVNAKVMITPEFYRERSNYNIIKQLLPKFQKTSQSDDPQGSALETIILTSNEKKENTIQWKNILNKGRSCDERVLKHVKRNVISSDPLCLQFTSGTTGQSKVATLSHNNFYNNSYHIAKRLRLFDKPHRFLIQSPFFHAFATDAIMCPCLHSGTTLVVPSPRYNPYKSLVAVEAQKCTVVNGTPTMFVDLIKLQNENNLGISSLEIGVVGGAPSSAALLKKMLNVLKLTAVKSVYGMTETSGVLFQSLPEDNQHQTLETVGFLQDHLEARVVDKNDKLVPFGQPGELHVKGYCNMLGYYKDPVKTKAIIDGDQWLRTGDQFVLYENGYGKVVGRLKDMIIRGGENIFPKEIEDFLNVHPKILDTQVFGVPDERLGEEVFCCIRVRGDEVITYEEVVQFCEGKLAKFKIPKYVRIVDDFPRTASGKIQKHKLRQIYRL